MSLLKKSGIVFLWSITGSAIGFAFQMGLANILGPSEYGKANIVFGTAGALAAFSSFGLPSLVTRECAKRQDISRTILRHSTVKLALFNLLAIPIYYLSVRLMLRSTALETKSIAVTAIVLLFGQTLSQLLYSYYKGVSLTERGSFIFNFAQRLVQVSVFFLLLSFCGPSFNLAVLSSLASYFLPLGILCFLVIRAKRDTRKIDLPFSSGLSYYLTGITYSVYDSFSKVLQGNFSGSLMVGALSFGLTLGAIGNLFGAAFASVAMPEFAKAWYEGDREHLRNTFMNVSRWNAYLVLPVVLFLALNIKRLIMLIGWETQGITWIILLVLAAQFFNSFVGPNGTLLNMAGQESREMRNGFIKLGVGLSLGFFLGPLFSWGIALSLAFAEIGVNVLKYIQLKSLFGIVPYKRVHICYLFLLAFASALMNLALSHLLQKEFPWILASMVLVSFLMGLSFYFSPEPSDRAALKSILEKLPLRY